MKFYLELKNCVDAALLFTKSNEFICQMQYVSKRGDKSPHVHEKLGFSAKAKTVISKIYNGEMPDIYKNMPLNLKLYGQEKSAGYHLNDLFSKPITKESVGKLLDKNITVMKNVIIINGPPEIKQVIIQVPDYVSTTLKLPQCIVLVKVDKKKTALLPPNASNIDALARGVDPQAEQFINTLNIDITALKTRFDDQKHLLDAEKFDVCCYFAMCEQEISFDDFCKPEG